MQFFGTKKLGKIEDWEPVVSKKNWVPKHSAYELAHSWQPAAGFPPSVAAVFMSCHSDALAGIRPNYGVVEKPVFLDTMKGPSWTDVMVYCTNADSEPLVVAVEGKAKEPFGPPVSDWIRAKGERGESPEPKPSRVRRLNYLSKQLGVSFQADSGLRYQLLHRTASVIVESELHSAAAAIVLVHSFYEESTENWSDYVRFVNAIGIADPRKNVVQGPVQLGQSGGTPLFLAWVSDRPVESSN